jgi:tetratricopeptide (TPR) repeat protein
MNDTQSLDALGIAAVTDKSSVFHDYLRHYEELFRPLRHERLNLIEIGVQGGNSLRMWRSFFSKATIVGIDILEVCCRHASDRIVVEIGSQADPVFLRSVAERYPPKIIVDDGSHHGPHIMASLDALFPALLPGGWYVVEDLDLSSGHSEVPISQHKFFPELAQRMVTGGAALKGDAPTARLARQIDQLTFIDGAVCIRKRDEAAAMADLAESERRAAEVNNPFNWYFLADTIMQRVGDLDRAEAAIRNALALNAREARFHERLSVVLERKGGLDGAIAAAEMAAQLEPKLGDAPSRLVKRLKALLQKRAGGA